MQAKHQDYKENFLNYYFVGDKLKSASVSEVPDEHFDNACTITEAISYVQKLGCLGRSQHIIHSEYHRCVLAVLKMAVKEYGEIFDVVYRGCSGTLPLNKHLILFATTDRAVAEFYGEVKEFRNIKGLRCFSSLKSVVTNNYFYDDEEIIFFP